MATRAKKSNNTYLQVKQEILHRIQSGQLPPGGLVPGEIELASTFSVARGTVNRAMTELVEQGYLERKRKGGTRVRSSPLRAARLVIPLVRTEIEATGANYTYSLLSRSKVAGPAEVRTKLQLNYDAQLLHLLCLHSADAKPFQIEERWINLATLPDAEHYDFAAVGPNEWLIQKVPYTDVEMKLSASIPPPHISHRIHSGDAQSLLMMQRTTWLNGISITHVRMHFHAGYELVTHY